MVHRPFVRFVTATAATKTATANSKQPICHRPSQDGPPHLQLPLDAVAERVWGAIDPRAAPPGGPPTRCPSRNEPECIRRLITRRSRSCAAAAPPIPVPAQKRASMNLVVGQLSNGQLFPMITPLPDDHAESPRTAPPSDLALRRHHLHDQQLRVSGHWSRWGLHPDCHADCHGNPRALRGVAPAACISRHLPRVFVQPGAIILRDLLSR